jgi:putative membrane protein
LLSGLTFDTPSKLVLAAIVLGVVNAVVRPLAFILTLPLTVLTLGLFLLVLNAGMVGLVAWMVPGFQISGFWTAVGAALIVSLVSWAASSAIGTNGRIEIFKPRR